MWLLSDQNYLGKAVIQKICNHEGVQKRGFTSNHSVLICHCITKNFHPGQSEAYFLKIIKYMMRLQSKKRLA